jgi:hypothetical protein
MSQPPDDRNRPTGTGDMASEMKDAETAENLGIPPRIADRDVVYARPAVHPLGPLIEVRRLQRPRMGRFYSAIVCLAAAGLLGTAIWLSPAGGHMGTHRQLGLLPCGFVTMTGYPCPTCGMTTAFAHAVRGHIGESIRSQPAGFALAVVTVVIGSCAAGALVAGRYPAINWYRINPTTFVWGIACGLVAAWGFKIAMGLLDGSLPAK